MGARALSVVGVQELRPCALCKEPVLHVEHTVYLPSAKGLGHGTLWEPQHHEAPCGRLCAASPTAPDDAYLPLHRFGCPFCLVSSWVRS